MVQNLQSVYCCHYLVVGILLTIYYIFILSSYHGAQDGVHGSPLLIFHNSPAGLVEKDSPVGQAGI